MVLICLFPFYLITLNIRLTVLLLIDHSFSILNVCIYLITTLWGNVDSNLYVPSLSETRGADPKAHFL